LRKTIFFFFFIPKHFCSHTPVVTGDSL
jgi:hypothetical protein